jgi:hypothetical protein
MAITPIQTPQAVAPNPKNPKYNPIDDVLKGLQAANLGFGIAVDWRKFENLGAANEKAAAEAEYQKNVLQNPDSTVSQQARISNETLSGRPTPANMSAFDVSQSLPLNTAAADATSRANTLAQSQKNADRQATNTAFDQFFKSQELKNASRRLDLEGSKNDRDVAALQVPGLGQAQTVDDKKTAVNAIHQFSVINANLDKMERIRAKSGVEVAGQPKIDALTAAADAQLAAKDLYQLGVLSNGDLDMLSKIIPSDPTKVTLGDMQETLQGARQIMAHKLQSRLETLGVGDQEKIGKLIRSQYPQFDADRQSFEQRYGSINGQQQPSGGATGVGEKSAPIPIQVITPDGKKKFIDARDAHAALKDGSTLGTQEGLRGRPSNGWEQ